MASASEGQAHEKSPVQYAGFGRRLAALLIDAPLRLVISLAVVLLPMRFLVLSVARELGSADPNYLWHAMSPLNKAFVFAFWLFAAILVPWLYTALQESSNPQATVGKRILGIQVTDLQCHRISFGRASGRFFARIIPTVGIGYLLVLFTRRKQALHDLIAQCLVVRAI